MTRAHHPMIVNVTVVPLGENGNGRSWSDTKGRRVMTVRSLDHYTIRTADVDASVAFYVDVLGLRNGKRPAFTVPGAWLYCGDSPAVHLIGGDGR